MKTNVPTKFTALLAAAILGGFWMPLSMNAQGNTPGSAKGGATQLLRVRATESTPIHAMTISHVALCENCKDLTVTVGEAQFKGAGPNPSALNNGTTKTVIRHLCTACRTQWKITGHGKSKVRVAVHTCALCS